MRDFKTLKVWEKAHQLTLDIYTLTATFPNEERYGLISQVRRSMASVPTNIAEGYGRSGQIERGHFMNIALGSTCEVEYQLLLSKDLGYVNESDYCKLNSNLGEVRKMLTSLYNKIKHANN